MKGAHCHEGDECIDALSLDVVVHRDHSSFSNLQVGVQRSFDLCCTNSMATDIDDIIHATCKAFPCCEKNRNLAAGPPEQLCLS